MVFVFHCLAYFKFYFVKSTHNPQCENNVLPIVGD